MSYTPQSPKLFSGSIEKNIVHDLKMSGAELQEVLHIAVLDEEMHSFDDGLNTFIGTGGMKLSGGQVQRVALARMLARQAGIYVLDDVSSALDVNTEKELWSRLFARKDETYIIVSNKKDLIERADNIIVMENGEITAEGSMNTLVNDSSEFRKIINVTA